jgi:hypothetical protein
MADKVVLPAHPERIGPGPEGLIRVQYRFEVFGFKKYMLGRSQGLCPGFRHHKSIGLSGESDFPLRQEG